MRSRYLVVGVVFLAACGGGHSQVSFVSNEQPTGYAPQGAPPRSAAHQEDPNGASTELADDDRIEPEHPLADSKQERALVHIHGPKPEIVCSGVVLGPKVIGTAQRCLRGYPKGATALGPDQQYRVEIASSSLTWTNRKAKFAVLPKCDETEFDLALLVLDEAVPALAVPLKIVSVPSTGAKVDVLGYGRCAGKGTTMNAHTGTVQSRDAQRFVIDLPLCRGDVGGPVFDGPDGEIIGIVSRRDNPRDSPLKTTAIARMDTISARDLMGQAKMLADGGGMASVEAVACR